MKWIIALFISLLSINTAFSLPLIMQLSSCDASFFKMASKNSQLKPIIDDFYYQKLVDGINFNKKINIVENDINLVNFVVDYTSFYKYKDVLPQAPTGDFYYWGVESSQPMEEVVNFLSNYISLIKIDKDNYVYNPMYRNSPDEEWKVNTSPASSIAPSAQAAEKLLLIEKDTKSNKVKVFCSLQGNLKESDLRHAGLIQ